MGWFAAHQSASLFQPPFGCRKNGSALPTGKLPAALQCHLMTSFPSEKIFYHGGTRIHTDGKAGSTMLDTNCANYRQLNSRLALIRTTIMQIFVFLAKNWPRENVRNAKKRSCVSGFFALQYVRIIVRREDFGVRWQSAAARSAGFQTCCVADFPVGRTSGSRASSGFGNPRYSRLGSPRYFGCGYAALGSFAALICGCGVSRAGSICVHPWLNTFRFVSEGCGDDFGFPPSLATARQAACASSVDGFVSERSRNYVGCWWSGHQTHHGHNQQRQKHGDGAGDGNQRFAPQEKQRHGGADSGYHAGIRAGFRCSPPEQSVQIRREEGSGQ